MTPENFLGPTPCSYQDFQSLRPPSRENFQRAIHRGGGGGGGVDFFWNNPFCAKSITYCLYPYTNYFCETNEDIKWILSGRATVTIIIILVIFEDMASKLEKINGPLVSSFNPFPSLPSVRITTDDRKQFQCSKIVFHNKTRPLFLEFSWRKDII